jgi:hypothetical protein
MGPAHSMNATARQKDRSRDRGADSRQRRHGVETRRWRTVPPATGSDRLIAIIDEPK